MFGKGSYYHFYVHQYILGNYCEQLDLSSDEFPGIVRVCVRVIELRYVLCSYHRIGRSEIECLAPSEALRYLLLLFLYAFGCSNDSSLVHTIRRIYSRVPSYVLHTVELLLESVFAQSPIAVRLMAGTVEDTAIGHLQLNMLPASGLREHSGDNSPRGGPGPHEEYHTGIYRPRQGQGSMQRPVEGHGDGPVFNQHRRNEANYGPSKPLSAGTICHSTDDSTPSSAAASSIPSRSAEEVREVPPITAADLNLVLLLLRSQARAGSGSQRDKMQQLHGSLVLPPALTDGEDGQDWGWEAARPARAFAVVLFSIAVSAVIQE